MTSPNRLWASVRDCRRNRPGTDKSQIGGEAWAEYRSGFTAYFFGPEGVALLDGRRCCICVRPGCGRMSCGRKNRGLLSYGRRRYTLGVIHGDADRRRCEGGKHVLWFREEPGEHHKRTKANSGDDTNAHPQRVRRERLRLGL